MRKVRVGARSRCCRRRHHQRQHPHHSNLPHTDDAPQVAALRAAAARVCAETEPFSLRFEAIFPSPDALVAVGDYGGCGCGCDDNCSNDDAKTLPIAILLESLTGHSGTPTSPPRGTARADCAGGRYRSGALQLTLMLSLHSPPPPPPPPPPPSSATLPHCASQLVDQRLLLAAAARCSRCA